MSAVARLFRAARERAGLSQQALAEKADLSFSTVIRLEGGKIKPQASTLFDLADVLGVPYDELRTAVAQDDVVLESVPT